MFSCPESSRLPTIPRRLPGTKGFKQEEDNSGSKLWYGIYLKPGN